MPADWYYKLGVIVVGPIPAEEMRRRADSGAIRPETLVREGQAGGWTEAWLIEGLLRPVQDDSRVPDEPSPESYPWPVPEGKQPRGRIRRYWPAAAAVLVLLVGMAIAWRPPTPAAVDPADNGEDAADDGELNTADQIAAMRNEIAKLRDQIAVAGKNGGQGAGAAGDAKERRNPIADLAARTEPSVVQIEVVCDDGKAVATGSGFIADANGLIVTNYHVIEGAEQVTITLQDGTEIVVGGYCEVAPGRDLAVLKVDLPEAFQRPLEISHDIPKKGDEVVAFGSTLGFQISVSSGIVSATRAGREVREVIDATTAPGFYETLFDLDTAWVQTTAPLSHGNSGGPLTDSAGRVIGINTWSAGGNAQNVNFATAASEILAILDRAKNAGIKPLATLPPPRRAVAEAAPVPKAPEEDKQRSQAKLLLRIYEQRAILIAQWETAKSKLQNIEISLASADGALSKLRIEAGTLQQVGFGLQQRSALLNARLLNESDPGTRIQLGLLLNGAVQSYDNCQARYRWIGAESSRLNIIREKLKAEANSVRSDISRLWQQSDQLRTEWTRATDVFAKFAAGDYEASIAALSEWVVLDGENPLPYLARGIVYHNAGQIALADADFAVASRLDPITAAKMVRDIQAKRANPPAPKGAGKRGRRI